ncbi:MAG: metallophosphoesterase family protein [Thermodesulfobacteriota bacterium]
MSCSKAVDKDGAHSEKEVFRVWVLADIQPRNSSHKASFTQAINDINKNVHDIKLSIVAGDIVHKTESETFDWYLKERNKSYIDNWYEIIGNHDLKTDKGKLFREKLREDIHYSKEFGNLLFIFLSDEIKGKPTDINEDTFQWWKNLVINNQDKIIVVVTHAPLEGSNIPLSTQSNRQILGSDRFIEVLKKYNVDLWLSGHLHLPHEFSNTLNKNHELNDTVFVHISSIRPEFLGLKHSQSRVLDFYCNEDKVVIKSRDHDSKNWNNEIEEEITLSKRVVCKP